MNTTSEFLNRPLTQEDLPTIESVPFHGHPQRYLSFLLLGTSGTILLIVPLLIAFLIFGVHWWGWALLGAWGVLVTLVLLETIKGFPIRGYALREHDITYKKGWLLFSKITIPFNRIQHCEISQGPMAQLFDLAELRVFTAGGAVSDLEIGGLPPDEAHRLREYIAKVAAYYE